MGASAKFVIQDADDLAGEVWMHGLLSGAPGWGKTWTALLLAKRFAEELNTWVGVIETERARSVHYRRMFPHKIARLTSFEPETYMEALDAFERMGCKVLVIDSLSQAWDGPGGILARVDKARASGGNSFNAWGPAKALQARFITHIMNFPGHTFVTARSKMEHAQVTDGGRTVVKKLGMDITQAGDIEYEFDWAIAFRSVEHDAEVTKSILDAYLPVGEIIDRPGVDLAERLLSWLNAGAPRTEEKFTIGVMSEDGDDIGFAGAEPQNPTPSEPPDISIGEFNLQLRAMGLDSVEASRMLGVAKNNFAGLDLRESLKTLERMVEQEREAAATMEQEEDPAPPRDVTPKRLPISEPEEGDESAAATKQQITSIGKLAEALGYASLNDEEMSFAQAKRLISVLSQEYQRMRRAS